jgi:hypothetical protein
MKKPAGLSVGAIVFAILVIALDFAVIRAACLGPRLELPADLHDRLIGRGSGESAVFAFFLLPMINALLIGAYRLRRRADHTAGTVGYVAAGTVATLAVFTSCLIAPGTAIGIITPISRPIALAVFRGLARLYGSEAWPNLPLEWTYAVFFAALNPSALLCIPPLLVALIGGLVARHIKPFLIGSEELSDADHQ